MRVYQVTPQWTSPAKPLSVSHPIQHRQAGLNVGLQNLKTDKPIYFGQGNGHPHGQRAGGLRVLFLLGALAGGILGILSGCAPSATAPPCASTMSYSLTSNSTTKITQPGIDTDGLVLTCQAMTIGNQKFDAGTPLGHVIKEKDGTYQAWVGNTKVAVVSAATTTDSTQTDTQQQYAHYYSTIYGINKDGQKEVIGYIDNQGQVYGPDKQTVLGTIKLDDKNMPITKAGAVAALTILSTQPQPEQGDAQQPYNSNFWITYWVYRNAIFASMNHNTPGLDSYREKYYNDMDPAIRDNDLYYASADNDHGIQTVDPSNDYHNSPKGPGINGDPNEGDPGSTDHPYDPSHPSDPSHPDDPSHPVDPIHVGDP